MNSHTDPTRPDAGPADAVERAGDPRERALVVGGGGAAA